jgi:1-acyl-sn-glycerol-3-phosphate acyltransferase
MSYYLKAILIILISLPTGFVILPLAPFDRRGKLAYRVSRLWTWSVLKIGGVRVRVHGLDRLDPNRPYIFMANHQSNIDIPVLVESLTDYQLRWVAKRELLLIPVFGWALWASKHITIDRTSPSQAMTSLRKARSMIESGISVVFFPEGTRSRGGDLRPFKRGGFLLAVKTKTPIVPVTIRGSRAVLPRGDWRIRKGEVEVIVSNPIPSDQCHPKDLPALLNQVRAIMSSQSPQGTQSHGEGPLAAQLSLPARASA